MGRKLRGALLSATAALPLVGDAIRTTAVVRKFVAFSDNLRLPVTKWITRQFPSRPTIRRALYKIVGANSGLESLDDVTLEALARSRNDLRRLSAILPDGRTLLRSVTLGPVNSAAISARVTRHLGATLTAAQKAEAVAVETAVELLMSRGNRILYVGRPGPVPGAATHVSQGPDIVAVTPAGRTVIVEAKGAVHKLSINNTRLKSTVAGRIERQPTRNWLALNPRARYLNVMSGSTDLGVREAVGGLEDINLNGGAYDAVIVGASPKTSLGNWMTRSKSCTPTPVWSPKSLPSTSRSLDRRNPLAPRGCHCAGAEFAPSDGREGLPGRRTFA